MHGGEPRISIRASAIASHENRQRRPCLLVPRHRVRSKRHSATGRVRGLRLMGRDGSMNTKTLCALGIALVLAVPALAQQPYQAPPYQAPPPAYTPPPQYQPP